MPSVLRRRDGGTAAGTHSARFGFAGFGHGARAGMSAQIVVGQFQIGVGGGLRGGREFVRAQRGAFLNAYAVHQEQSQIGGHYEVEGRSPVGDAVKLVGTRVPILLESHVPQFHCSLPALTLRRQFLPGTAVMGHHSLTIEEVPCEAARSSVAASSASLSSPEPSSMRIGWPSSPRTGRPSSPSTYSLSSDPAGFSLRCARLAALSRCFSIRAISFCRF